MSAFGLQYPEYEPCAGFDHILDKVFTCIQRNLVILICGDTISSILPASENCIVITQVLFILIFYNTDHVGL